MQACIVTLTVKHIDVIGRKHMSIVINHGILGSTLRYKINHSTYWQCSLLSCASVVLSTNPWPRLKFPTPTSLLTSITTHHAAQHREETWWPPTATSWRCRVSTILMDGGFQLYSCQNKKFPRISPPRLPESYTCIDDWSSSPSEAPLRGVRGEMLGETPWELLRYGFYEW